MGTNATGASLYSGRSGIRTERSGGGDRMNPNVAFRSKVWL